MFSTSSTAFLKALPTVLLLAGSTAARSWLQKSDIRGNQFLETYSFFSGADPTHGMVNYAQGPMLSWVDDNDRFNMKVDTHQHVSGNRGSVRISSNYWVSDGVIIANVTHAPSGCGVWPAFWTLGEGQWPYGGEIDILEWANDAEWEDGANTISLHTPSGCYIDQGSFTSTNQTGRLLSHNCNTLGKGNSGCSVRAKSNQVGFGTAAEAFNAQGGGVVAMERDFSWGGKGIRVWQWSRNDTDSMPEDVASGSLLLDTSKWGAPTAAFAVNPQCKFAFNDHQIIFDIVTGGEWDAGAFPGTSCEKKYGSIENLVRNHGSAYSEAYWSIDSVKHFV
ncbi:hypothetical protein OC834_005852 [Tilletia horrida]|uniref:GH16 domain-containing protein n=1 Tax=Tilletia horrida TaxID=155126 RepID=A0AAN6GBA4_9BASI|nr:hypothetical protein OC835_006438 [Tilletia horrida]KAK0523563.1 hypothetical protein OC834_005852 [Tilletia horrida]KAK0527554.1 hypothetical protein OC842_004835 [Tilletia horrida]KAK0565057.1 hypothetical protein OC844_001394 [Tilletia horrida]